MYRWLDKLTPIFRKKVELFLKEAWDTIFITESHRTQKRQKELYAQWRTKPWNIVTWTLTSNHNIWIAIDIAFKWDSLYPTNHLKRKEVWIIANKYWIDWGFDLWGVDNPHFQDNWKPLALDNYRWLKIEIWNKCKKTSYNACYLHEEDLIILQDNFFKHSESKKESILLHEFSHYIFIKKVPKFYQKLRKSISEFNPDIIKKVNRLLWTNYLGNVYITKYAEKNFLEDFSECIEESSINKTGYKGYLWLKVLVANKIFNKFDK